MNSKLGAFLLAVQLIAAVAPVPLKMEFGKMDHLIRHYIEHRQEVPAISFFDFLSLHYGKAYDFHQDDHQHSNLPGKGDAEHAHAILCTCVFPDLPQNFELNIRLPQFTSLAHLPKVTDPVSSLLSSGIWQPPRR